MKLLKRYIMHTSGMLMGSAVVAVLVIAAYYTGTFGTKAESSLAVEPDRHVAIAITCPYAPYFGIGGESGTEWQLIVTAFADFGLHAKHLYVSYEDALRYFQSEQVKGVWICGGMGGPINGYFASAPLLERRFVVVTLAENEIEFEYLEMLANFQVGAHPDVLRVLQPQIKNRLEAAESFREIANHALLASLLFTGRIDALITEQSVFEMNLQSLPREADPSQQVHYHRLFESVYPRILFKDQALRDRFNEALKKTDISALSDK